MSRFLRPALPADVPRVFEIRTSVRENLLTMPELAALGITPEAIAELFEMGGAWVAGAEGVVQGFAIADLLEGSLFALFVAPGAEGQGYGRALLAAAEQALFARHPLIHLETGPGTRAARFYREAGWQLEGGEVEWRFVKQRV